MASIASSATTCGARKHAWTNKHENLNSSRIGKEKLTPKTKKTTKLTATKKTIFKRKEKCNIAGKTPSRGKSNGNVRKIIQFLNHYGHPGRRPL